MPPQLFKGTALDLANGAFRHSQDRGNLPLAEAPKLLLSAARTDTDGQPGRHGTLSRPPSLGLAFPSLAQGQGRLTFTQARAPPDLPSRPVSEGGNPSAATAGQMDADFDQTPGVHRPVCFNQDFDNFFRSHALNYRGPRHGPTTAGRRAVKGQSCQWDGCARGRMAVSSGAFASRWR